MDLSRKYFPRFCVIFIIILMVFFDIKRKLIHYYTTEEVKSLPVPLCHCLPH